MTEEIKEILEHLSATQKINNGWTSFSVEECKSLYGYITNLQKENETNKNYCDFYKDMSNKWKDLSDVFKKSYEDYKSRNEKAVEYIKSKKAIINTDYIRIFDLFEIEEQGYTKDLLDILEGGDE